MSQSKEQRLQYVDKAKKLSIARQCELIEVTRSSFYYKPAGESNLNLELMRLIDEEYLLHPWLGVPRMTTWLREDKGFKVNHKRIERLYKLMGLSAIGPKPNTSKKGKGKRHRCCSLMGIARHSHPEKIQSTHKKTKTHRCRGANRPGLS